MNKYSISIILMCLFCVSWAQTTFTVSNTNDSGVGSLRQAILDAETSPGADIIDMTGITGTITLASDLPNISQDLTINGAGSANTIIDGNSLYRPFFIGGAFQGSTEVPVIAVDGLTIQNGYSEGESPTGNAGGGAGMGGGMFVNNGDVTMTNVLFSGNSVLGGTGGNDRFGGGGEGGDGPFENSGGVAAALPPGAFVGGAGGYGAGGGGGIGTFNFGGADGGIGGYGAGGGGAGGGNLNGLGNGGAAGAFGGTGGNAISLAHAGGGGGAGLGGAMYIRNGTVVLENISFQNNTATGGAGGNAHPEPSGGNGQGRGGAVFNDAGTVTMTFFSFSGNTTSTASPDTHGTISFITDVAITAEPADQLNINEGTDDAAFSVTTTGTVETYQWQVDDGNGFVDITNDANYSGSTSATLDITCVPRAFQNYQYRVQIGGTLNDVTSQAASLTVTNVPDLMATIASTDLVVQCDGESLTFTSSNQNVNTTPAYKWLVNGVAVTGETSDTFTGALNEGDEVSLELAEPSSCFPRPAAISNVLTVQRIKVDTVVIANTLTGRTDVGSLPYHLAQTVNLPCNDIITVMDLRQLPQGSIISMDQALFTQSPVHIIGNGSDETIIRATTDVSTAMLGRFHKLEGFKLENTSGANLNAIDVFADSLVMFDVIVTGFNASSRQVLEFDNVDVDNNPADYYVSLDSVQLLGGRHIELDIDGNQGVNDVTGTIKIVNSVFKNALYHNVEMDFSEADFLEVLIQGNLFQDNDLSTLQAFFNGSVAGGTFTIEQNSVINQLREALSFEAEQGNDIDVIIRNNTFSETGVRGFAGFPGDYPVVSIQEVDAQIINNTMVGVQDVLSISTSNQIVFANNLVLDEVNGVNIFDNATPDYTGSGNNIGIDIGDNNDLTSTTLQVIQSLTLSDPGGNGLLAYEPVDCGPAADFGNETLAPLVDQIGRVRFDPDIGAIESQVDVVEQQVAVMIDPFPFPGAVTFTPDVSPDPNPPVITYTYQWTVNDVNTSTDEIFNATNLVAGDEIQLEVTSNVSLCRRPNPFVSEVVSIREAFSLQSTTISEDLMVGGLVTPIIPDGSLSAGATFSLVAGTGDTDNASFTVSGTDLVLASGLDFETAPSLSIRLSVSDGGQMFEQAIALTITDVNDSPVFTSMPATLLQRDDVFQYDIVTSDDEGTDVAVQAISIPDWLTFNQNSASDEDIIASSVRTGIPNGARDLVVDASGNIYIADASADNIKKIDPAGNETLIADQSTPVYVSAPYAMDMAPDGTIYVADISRDAILKIENDVISVFVSGLPSVSDVVAQSNTVLYVTAEFSKVFRIENGVPTLFAGTGTRTKVDGPFGVGTIANPNSIDVDLQGRVWLQDGGDIRVISPDGAIETIDPVISFEAGTLNAITPPFSFDAGTYTGYQSDSDIEVDVFGNVHISRGGVITSLPGGSTTAGNELTGNVFFGNQTVDGNKNDAIFGRIDGMFFASDGSLYTVGSSTNSSSADHVIRKVTIPAPTFSLTGTAATTGEFPVTLRASDGTTTTDQNFTIEVLGPLRFEADPVTAATEGAQYIYNPSAVQSQGTPFTYGFTLPDWLNTSVPVTATSFLNLASGVPGVAPFSRADATVTDEAVYTIQGNTISSLKFDGSMVTPIDFSSLNPEPSVVGPFITSNTEGELYFAFKIEDPNAGEQDKLYKVDPNADPIVFTDLGTFNGIKDIDIHENGVVIFEQRFDNNSLVGDISIVDDAGAVTSVISGSDAEAINVGLDGKIYFLGGSNFQPDDHSEFIAELELNGTITTRTIFTDQRVYSVQDLVVDAFGNAYILYESLDEMANIFDSYGYLENSSVIEPLFTASDDVNTFELSGFTRFGSTNDIFYTANDNAAGVSDLFAYADNAIIFGTPGATDAGPNNLTITLDDQNEIVTQAFTINIPFVNEPPTGINISGNSINENNPTSTSILTFTTIDPNSAFDVFTYELISGSGDDDNGEFTISNDGLQANQSYDFEANPGSKSIRVRSTDLGGESVEETFTIRINDVNETPTAIALSGNMEVAENLPAGTAIGSLTTTDQDASDTHTYSLSGTGSDLFQVVGNVLQTAASLDFEIGSSYTLTITTTDAGQLTFNDDFTITIINDAPTDITLSNGSIDEGLLPGAIIGTFGTTDSDPNNTFSYAFVAGANLNALFEIDGTLLKTRGIFDASLFTSATIRVSTTDAIGESFEKDLTVTVNDLTNSPPQLLNAPSANATQGALYTYAPGIYDFNNDVVTLTSTLPTWLNRVDQPATVEEFLAENGANNLEIDDDDNLYITINDANGTATNIMKYDDNTEMTSTLLSTDATSISFVDVDDNGVVYFSDNNFQGSSWLVKKLENGTVSTVYTALGDVIAGGHHDDGYLVLVETQADNTRDMIRVDLNGANKMTLEEEVGFVGVFNIGDDDNIHYSSGNTMSAIDIDGNAATAVTIQLTTDNTNSPYLYFISDFVKYSGNEAYVLYVEADAAGTQRDVLVRVRSTGEEELWRGMVTYEASKIAANASSEVFFTRDPDTNTRHAIAKYSRAFTFFHGTPGDSDVGNSTFGMNLSDGTAANDYSFTIAVSNINDAPTAIALSGSSINENNAMGVGLLTLSATDPDNDSGDSHTFALVSGTGDTNNGSFEIVGSELRAKSIFDHESGPTKSIRVKASDATNTSFEQTLSISIADLNESPTAIQLSSSSINENSTVGTTIGTLSTVDPDATNANLVFEVMEGAQFVSISGTELKSAASFDFETTPSFSVKIKASDGVANSGNFFTIEQSFTITVGDVSESPTDLALSNATVAENAVLGTTIGTLTAQDPDGSSTAAFSLVSGADDNASFSIEGNLLKTAAVFNFENKTSYIVNIQVTDGTGNSFTEKFTITITDANEAPVFSTANTISVAENSTAVTTLAATDSDAGATLTYSIADGADKDLFALSGQVLTFASARDFESPADADVNNVYQITVRVSDGTNQSDLALSVTVTDVNEAPVTGTTNALTVVENTTTPIAIVASDADANSTLTYSLTGGLDKDKFTVSGANVSFVNAPDFEVPVDANSDNVYAFTVRVSDGTHSVDTEMTVTVTNANESPTGLTISANTVDENAAVGTAIGTLTSTDTDATFTHTYSLPSAETNFKIQNNQLQTNAVFDFETQQSYEVTVTVTDEGSLSFEQKLTISVNDLDETKPNSSVIISAIDDRVTGSDAFELAAVTNPENATVIWSVVEGDATINGTTLTPGTQSGLVVVKAVIEATTAFNGSEDTESFNLLDPTLIDPTLTVTLPREAAVNETVTIAVSFDALGATTVSETDVVLEVVKGPGTINGNQLSFTGSGTVEVSASVAATAETNAAVATDNMEVFQVYSISGRALADGNGYSNGIAFLVASDNFNETLNVLLDTEGNFTFQNVKEGDYFLGIGVPQTETTYLSTFLGDKSPVLDPMAIPDVLKLSADVSGLVINMQSKPAPAVDLVDPTMGGKIEFQAQGAPDGQNRIILGRVEMGDPIPNTQVVLSDADGAYVADGLTDENGFITFEGLPTGDYKIGVEIPGVGRVETDIPVEEGEQADVTGLISEDGTVALEIEEVLNVDLEKEALTIYPNPVMDQLNLTLENDYRGELTIRVFDLNGKTVLGFNDQKLTGKLEIKEQLALPAGTYLIQIIGIDLNLQQRFIKR